MTTPETAPVEVTQADRQFFRSIALRGDSGPNISQMLAAGAWDEDSRMLEIVRFRLTHRPARQDGLREALESIAKGAELSERHFEARLAARKNRLSWFVVNVLQDALASCKGTARAALSDISPLANEGEPVAWLYNGPDGEHYIREHRDLAPHWLARNGWTETPLYPRPLANDTGALREAAEPWPGCYADLQRRRVTTLAKLGLMLSIMAGGDAPEVVGFDAADLYGEVLMALAIEDADNPDIALEDVRDHPEGDMLARAQPRDDAPEGGA